MRKHFNDLRNDLPDLSAFAFHHKIRILFIKRHAFRIEPFQALPFFQRHAAFLQVSEPSGDLFTGQLQIYEVPIRFRCSMASFPYMTLPPVAITLRLARMV